MIYRLRRKIIWICSASVTAVFAVIFILICVFSMNQLNSVMDGIADRIAENDGAVPAAGEDRPAPPEEERFPFFSDEESRFSARFFIVRYDADGKITSTETERISSVTGETAREYAEAAVRKDADRGWIGGYRYKICDTSEGQSVIFVDGEMNRSVSVMTVLTAGAVLLGSLAVIVVLIVIFSKRAVRPVAESYEKQKQFITDANHELKTPLTLILANLDILESEMGKNEWLSDIRAEGEHMNALVRQLVALSRMDEEENGMPAEPFPISDTISDTVSEFRIIAEQKGLRLHSDIQENEICTGNEAAIRHLVSILLDNAVKYCDPGGEIRIAFYRKRKFVIKVENTCSAVDSLELDRLFDRFYRADKARSADGGFGIGLSIAKAVARRHHGDISAYRKDGGYIGFKAAFR